MQEKCEIQKNKLAYLAHTMRNQGNWTHTSKNHSHYFLHNSGSTWDTEMFQCSKWLLQYRQVFKNTYGHVWCIFRYKIASSIKKVGIYYVKVKNSKWVFSKRCLPQILGQSFSKCIHQMLPKTIDGLLETFFLSGFCSRALWH